MHCCCCSVFLKHHGNKLLQTHQQIVTPSHHFLSCRRVCLLCYVHNSDKLVARLGVDDLNGKSAQMIPVARWINHDPYTDYQRHKRSPLTDLALVRLAWPARFTPHVQPIFLPTRRSLVGELCVTSGWGFTARLQSDLGG